MSIHSELPNDLGLELWSVWSKNDPDYINDWDKHNPCEAVWKSFKGSGRGIGSLIRDADEVDPKRLRFSPVSRDIVDKAQNELLVRTRRVKMSFQEVKKEYKILKDTLNSSVNLTDIVNDMFKSLKKINPNDLNRLKRIWEVFIYTKIPMSNWIKNKTKKFLDNPKYLLYLFF